MKYINNFKQFEKNESDLESESDDLDELNFSDEEESFQRRMKEKEARKRIKPQSVLYGSGSLNAADLKGYNPVKYTDVPLDVYLQRKKEGTEDLPKKIASKFGGDTIETRRKQTPADKAAFRNQMVDDIKVAILNVNDLKEFKEDFPYLWSWAKNNFSSEEMEIFKPLFDADNRRMQKEREQKIIDREKQKEEKRRQKDLELKKNQSEKAKALEKKEKLRDEYRKISELTWGIDWFDNFELLYPNELKWIKDNRFIKEFLMNFRFGPGTFGLLNVPLTDSEKLELKARGFVNLNISPGVPSQSMMTARSKKNSIINITKFRFKDLRGDIFIIKVNGKQLPVRFNKVGYREIQSNLGLTFVELRKWLELSEDSL